MEAAVSKRISKRMREEAAVLASILACEADHDAPDSMWWTPYGGATPDAYRLWGKAYDLAYDARGASDNEETKKEASAEAEALLRTGWTP